MLLVPRETLVCVSTHYRVETFIGVNSGNVKMVCFWFLGRCQDGLVLIPREMSPWFGLISRETLGCVSTHYWLVPFTEVYSGDVKMVWFYARLRIDALLGEDFYR